jgi:hypothetical protein
MQSSLNIGGGLYDMNLHSSKHVQLFATVLLKLQLRHNQIQLQIHWHLGD